MGIRYIYMLITEWLLILVALIKRLYSLWIKKNKFYLYELIFYSFFYNTFLQTPTDKPNYHTYFIANMKKLLHQRQFVTRDHYFLPEDNEPDIQTYKERSFYEQKAKKSKIQINNFTQNMNIKINIKIDDDDDNDFSQLKIVSSPSKWNKPVKNTVNLESEKRVTLQNPSLSSGIRDHMRTSKERNQFFHISLKNPQIDRKNKRYYNTELFSAFSSTQKNPQQIKQERYSVNSDYLSSKTSQKGNQFSSVRNNNFTQKPFYLGYSVQKPDRQQENTTNYSPKQQTRQHKEVHNQGKIQVREQVSLDYFSNSSSKKRLKTMIQDNCEKEVESQIYLQNQHSVGVQNEQSPAMRMQEYFFHHSANDDKNISGLSDSAICEQSNSIEEKVNPAGFQVKNVTKSSMNEVGMQPQGRKIDFQPEGISASQINQEQQYKRASTNEPVTNPHQTINLQMFEFKETELLNNHSYKIPSNEEPHSSLVQHHKPSLGSLQHASSDKLSVIDKLRQLQNQCEEPGGGEVTAQTQTQMQIQRVQSWLRRGSEQLLKKQGKGGGEEFDAIGEESEGEGQREERGDFTFSPAQMYHTGQKQRNIEQLSSTAPQLSFLLTKSPSPLSTKPIIDKPSPHIKQEGYSKRSRSKSKDSFIPFSTNRSKMHHHKEHCFEPGKPRGFIFQDYSCRNKKAQQHHYCKPQIASERSSIRQQQRINKPSPKKQPKVVKANLTNKKAEDLFTKHKNQFLYKLKMKQNSSNQTVSTQQKSREKSSSKRANLNNNRNIRPQSSGRNRSISPYVKQLSQRLYSHDLGPICGHYQRHSKRLLRERFFAMVLQDYGNILKQYYLSNDQLHEIFVSRILNKQMNEHHWIEIVKRQGQRKLENLRLKSKSKYHPNQRSIIKKQQVAADTKRAYPFAISVVSNSLQKVKAY